MNVKQLIMVGVTLVSMQSAHANNVGSNVLSGVVTGGVSLGAFYTAQKQFNETEGRALALSTLTGIVLSALIQAKADRGVTDFFTTLGTAAVTFALAKYVYEQNQVASANAPVVVATRGPVVEIIEVK